MMKRFRVFLLALSLTGTIGVGGAYATWRYAGKMTEESAQMAIGMGEWTPDVVLPGGEGTEEEEQGVSQLYLIEKIVNDLKAGLNYKPSVLIGAIEDSGKNPYAEDNLFFSDQDKVTGGNIKFLLEDNIQNLDFLMQTVTEDQAYYFYSYVDIEVFTSPVEAYRTLVEKKNGEWIAVSSAKGYASVDTFKAGGNVFYGILADTWTAGTPKT